MIGILSKLFGGSKSDKDVKRIQPLVTEINRVYDSLQSLSHDELRNKTQEFRAQISAHLKEVDEQITTKKAEADSHPEAELHLREAIYNDVAKLIQQRDEQIEVILKEILPEAFAVVKETARRFKENPELTVTATE